VNVIETLDFYVQCSALSLRLVLSVVYFGDFFLRCPVSCCCCIMQLSTEVVDLKMIYATRDSVPVSFYRR
jgi:hypothetical protein